MLTANEVAKRLEEHQDVDKENFDLLMRVIFGDKNTGDMGMMRKLDEIYNIIKDANIEKNGVSKLFNSIKGGLIYLTIIAGVVGLIKGWWIGLLAAIKASLVS